MRMGRKFLIQLVCIVFILSIFQNVSAVSRIYSIEDSDSYVNITGGEKFNVSLKEVGSYAWEIRFYDSSIISIEDERLWRTNPDPEIMGSGYTHNWTFEGKHKGNTTISFVYWDYFVGNTSIRNNFTLYVNVTSNAPMSTFWKMIIIVTIIIVVPTAIILKGLKGRKEI